jgi:hypothetical protein
LYREFGTIVHHYTVYSGINTKLHEDDNLQLASLGLCPIFLSLQIKIAATWCAVSDRSNIWLGSEPVAAIWCLI